MANIGSALKAEMARIARRALSSELQMLRKAAAEHRRRIAVLGRAIASLEKRTKPLEKQSARSAKAPIPIDQSKVRFSAKGLASLRARLGISAEDLGRLIGATGQSVYYWESGKSTPRKVTVATIAGLRGLGKREVERRLSAVRESGVRAGGRAARPAMRKKRR